MPEFKVLSLDGGGIRGLYTATILANFEEQFNCNIVDHFDLICGIGVMIHSPAFRDVDNDRTK